MRANRKAAKAAKDTPSGNGKGHKASHSHSHDGEEEGISDSDCSECSEEEKETADDDGSAFTESFFKQRAGRRPAGTTSLLDAGVVTDAKALLTAIEQRVAETEATGPPTLESTGAPAADHPALMVRSAPAAPEHARRRFYSICYGPRPGIYYGSWDAPDNVRTLAEGISRSGNNPTHKGHDNLAQCVEWNAIRSVCITFRGPNVPDVGPTSLT